MLEQGQSKLLENHTLHSGPRFPPLSRVRTAAGNRAYLHSGTYLYSPYMAVPLPPGGAIYASRTREYPCKTLLEGASSGLQENQNLDRVGDSPVKPS